MIIVTHNANMVVNTDVDQVIVASCVKPESGSPPEFYYVSGGLEDPVIRAQVCDIARGWGSGLPATREAPAGRYRPVRYARIGEIVTQIIQLSSV